MELGDGRGGQLGEEDSPYIVQEQIQPLSTNSACEELYYRTRQAVLLQEIVVLPQGIAVLPLGGVVLPRPWQRPEEALLCCHSER